MTTPYNVLCSNVEDVQYIGGCQHNLHVTANQVVQGDDPNLQNLTAGNAFLPTWAEILFLPTDSCFGDQLRKSREVELPYPLHLAPHPFVCTSLPRLERVFVGESCLQVLSCLYGSAPKRVTVKLSLSTKVKKANFMF